MEQMSGGEQAYECTEGVTNTLAGLRQVEQGILQAPSRLEFYLRFERSPVWLLALDAEIVKHVLIVGFQNAARLYQALELSLVDTHLIRAAINNISSERVSYTMDDEAFKPGAVVLVSGSFEFVRQWTSEAPNPTLVLCENHICSLSLCNKQLWDSSELWCF
jgi:hypothetical protein